AVSIHVLQGERPMAADNRTLGRFELVGIPPAPRGLPQIEVTFDIDANGIVHVSAKDLGTGKEQSIKITASSGLSEEEIQKLVKDAEAHADEDKRKRDLVEARNHADSFVYSVEKNIKEFGDKIDAAEKAKIEDAMAKVRKSIEGDDLEAIKKAQEELTTASHKLAEAMYAKTAEQQGGPGAGATGAGAAGAGAGTQAGGGKKDDDVVDADFEEVK
ncbi:MAG TPA: Hsp70 family protein, partial [Syntrophales bacterium]|nr:Hsp70 family protein [Syntrophales bacterium]